MTNKTLIRVQAIALLMLVLLMQTVHAQANRATINGTVKDQQGAVVPAVTVTAKNDATGVDTRSTTDSQGFYSILNLPVGTYTLTFNKTGFMKLDRAGITLITAQVAKIDVSLAIGSANEVVTVTSSAPVVETETSDISADLQVHVITELPMNAAGGRNAENFVFSVMPGVEGNAWSANINGAQAFTKDVKIDGVSITSGVQGDQGEVGPSMEAVEEVNVQTSGASADTASTAGGVESFTIKSGTNQFHGSAFGYGHNEILDANTWSNNYYGLERAKDRLWDWGFSAGGPVWIPKLYNGKNKTFIFGAFEKYQQSDFRMGGVGTGATVPTADFLNGDFSALLAAGGNTPIPGFLDGAGNQVYVGSIFDPTTGNLFAGNVIPSGRLSAVSKKIAAIYSQYYKPDSSTLTANELFPSNTNPTMVHHQYTFRVDHNLTAKNRLSGDYIRMYSPRLLADQGGVWQQGSTDGGPLAYTRTQIVAGNSFRISDSHTFTDNLLNVAAIGYNRFWNGATPPISTNFPPTLGFGDTGANNFPRVQFADGVAGVTETSIGNTYGGFYIAGAYILNDTMTWVHGHHTLKFGGEGWRQLHNQTPATNQLSFSFSGLQTGAPTTPYKNYVGFAFASFMLGDVQQASETTGILTHGKRSQYALFVQDDFRLNPRLTLNLGLRWDVTSPLTEADGRWTVFNPNVMDTQLGIKGLEQYANSGSKSFEGDPDYKQFGPHVGFAYQAMSRLVARGSYGITYVPIGLQTWSAVPYGATYGFTGSNAVALNSNFTPAFNWDNGYPGAFVPGVKDPHVTIQPGVGYAQTIIDPHGLSQGYSHQFNIGVEYAIAKDTRISANYVGNRGRRLHDGNLGTTEATPAATLGLYQSGTAWDWVSDSASAATAGVPLPFNGFQGYAWQAINQFPQLAMMWDGVYFVNTHKGKTSYDALQLEAVRRAGKGATFDVSYVLSQSLGNTNNAFTESWTTGAYQDFSKLDAEAGLPTSGDTRHIVKGYVSYDLPFGHGQRYLANNSLANWALGGWKVTGMVRYNSGQPLFVYASNPYSGLAALYPNVNKSGNFSSQFHKGKFAPYTGSSTPPTGDKYFTPTLYSQPAYGTLGTGPEVVSANRGFGYADEDMTFLKNTAFGADGKYRLSFRVEFYNLLNRHYYSNPTTDMTSPQFGYVTGVTGTGRNGQFGARFQW
jgi:hypothetical protein